MSLNLLIASPLRKATPEQREAIQELVAGADAGHEVKEQ